MKELNLQQLENLEGGKRRFWGWGVDNGSTTSNSNCSSGYSHTETHYVLGIAVGHATVCTTLGNC